ncbi:hypothetical protein TUZN_0233 [Thermoproteus uzoniensis 768-20]|uniref:Uncharacterized protein n=1 Tax=Thermoproteus uzoniensis (strain 768-20) TaxID=999630 RepID=F2L1Z0_THEU7|nr:hypothetical protein [Thermoproteus uzoniensis]AEA11731.1 hypothetical protein TUZN_0233 [Thermoproteus uzoniensis 768-20]
MKDRDEVIKQIINTLKILGIDIDEMETCEIYFNYLNYKLSYIEKTLDEIKEKIIFIENLKCLNRKEMHK